MAQTLSIVGVERGELPWIRVLIALLRHPNPEVRDLVCHALVYLAESSGDSATEPDSGENQYRSARNLVS